MDLIINGRTQTTPALATVAELAAWLELPAFGSAIELNGEVVRKGDYAGRALQHLDRLEVVKLVGGG